MKRYFSFLFIIFFIVCIYASSCKINPDSNRNYADKSKVYKLYLNPAGGSKYYFDITNESDLQMEVDDKKINSINKTNIGMNYGIDKDSSGNILLTTRYDKLHIYSKNGDDETDLNADNAKATLNPAEELLGYLKEATITASVDPTGEIKNISGYKEIGDKIMASFAPNDISGKKIAQQQWDKAIGEGIVKRNMDELFKIFPDSAIHIGDSWKLSSEEMGEIPLNIKNIFRLKAINDDVALVESEGIIAGNNSSTNLKGTQQGEYEIETKTGMLISCRLEAKLEGTIETMGREIPVEMETSVKINGRKLK